VRALEEATQDAEGRTLLHRPYATAGDTSMLDIMESKAFRDSWMERKAALAVQSRSLRDRLRQDRIWTSADGTEHRVARISSSYARTLLRWLERRARFCYEGLHAEFLFIDTSKMGDAAADSIDDEMNALYYMTAQEWLAEQPLYIALKRRAESRREETLWVTVTTFPSFL